MQKTMKPVCPGCGTKEYVYLLNTVEKVGTVAGGVTGAASCYIGAESGAVVGGTLGSLVPVVGTGAGMILGGLAAAASGFLAGATLGNMLGQHIDEVVIRRYRCNRCGNVFEV